MDKLEPLKDSELERINGGSLLAVAGIVATTITIADAGYSFYRGYRDAAAEAEDN